MRRDTFKQNEDVKLALETQNVEQELFANIKKMTDSQLFTVNANKDGLNKKRDKLRADRFKRQEQKIKSHTEEVLIKRFQQKQPPQVKVEKDDLDIWGQKTPSGTNVQKFKEFCKR